MRDKPWILPTVLMHITSKEGSSSIVSSLAADTERFVMKLLKRLD